MPVLSFASVASVNIEAMTAQPANGVTSRTQNPGLSRIAMRLRHQSVQCFPEGPVWPCGWQHLGDGLPGQLTADALPVRTVQGCHGGCPTLAGDAVQENCAAFAA
jgi:hypothetical protein